MSEIDAYPLTWPQGWPRHRGQREWGQFKGTPGAVKPWHEVLDVPAHTPTDEVKARYRELAKRRHPDTGGGHEAFAELNTAYQAFQKERGLA